jgi:ERF superfamily protein
MSEPVQAIVSDEPIRKTDEIGELAKALAAAQLDFKPTVKDTINPYYNSKYADLASVINATQTALAKQSLVVIQTPVVDLQGQRAGVKTMLVHGSGQSITTDLVLPATMKSKDGSVRFDAQSVGSAITYARRYTYQAIIGVAAEADDDGNAASGLNGSKEAAQAVATRKINEARPNGNPQPETIEFSASEKFPGVALMVGHAGLSVLRSSRGDDLDKLHMTWLERAKCWIIPFESVNAVAEICKELKVSPVLKLADAAAPAAQDIPVMAEITSIIRKESRDHKSKWLSVVWGGQEHSCFDQKLWPFLTDGLNQAAELTVTSKEKAGKVYYNIVGIVKIGDKEFSPEYQEDETQLPY